MKKLNKTEQMVFNQLAEFDDAAAETFKSRRTAQKKYKIKVTLNELIDFYIREKLKGENFGFNPVIEEKTYKGYTYNGKFTRVESKFSGEIEVWEG